MPELPSVPDFPRKITPEQITGWCDALGIDRAEAAAMIGKAPNYWSRLADGQVDLRLSQLNTLLTAFAIRAEALRNQ